MAAQAGSCYVVGYPHSAECKGCGKTYKKRSKFNYYCGMCSGKVYSSRSGGSGLMSTRRKALPE